MKSRVSTTALVLILVLAAGDVLALTAVPRGARPVGAAVAMAVSGDLNYYEGIGFGNGPEIIPVRYCGRYWVRGHYNRWGAWVRPHWRYRHWVRGHYDRHGHWVRGCFV